MILLDPKQTQVVAEMDMAKMVGEALQATYPGHLWAVICEGNVIKVSNLALSGRWGFVMHCKTTDANNVKKKVTQHGGELLERYRVSRTANGSAQAMIRMKSRMDRPSLDGKVMT